MRHILWKEVTSGDFHIARSTKTPKLETTLHDHNFAEVFWVEAGTGEHVLPSVILPLQQGDMYFIRPQDAHGLRTQTELRTTNLAFSMKTFQFLQSRYPERFLWKSGQQPRAVRLDSATLNWVVSEADRLFPLPRTPFYVERFLMNLTHRLSESPPFPVPPSSAPPWLRKACEEIRKQEHFSIGVRQFVKLACRSPEHVSRVTRECLGEPPAQYINRVRMLFAAQQLTMTDQDIIDISLACGYANLSHFYRTFKKMYNKSPYLYRKQQRVLS